MAAHGHRVLFIVESVVAAENARVLVELIEHDHHLDRQRAAELSLDEIEFDVRLRCARRAKSDASLRAIRAVASGTACTRAADVRRERTADVVDYS